DLLDVFPKKAIAIFSDERKGRLSMLKLSYPGRRHDPIRLGLVTLCISATLSAGQAPVSIAAGTRASALNASNPSKLGSASRDSATTRPNSVQPVVVTLSPATSPTMGQPAVTVVNITGNGFPSGSMPPTQVTIQIEPVSPAAGSAAFTPASAVVSLTGNARRISFQIPTSISVSVPTAYLASVSGS